MRNTEPAFSETGIHFKCGICCRKERGGRSAWKKFDMVDEQDNLFGAKTWEEAESNMQKEACILAIGKAGLKPEKIRYLFGEIF